MTAFLQKLSAYKKTVLAALAFLALVLTQFTQTFGTQVPPTVTAVVATVIGLIGTVTAVIGDFSQPAAVKLAALKAKSAE